MSTGFLFVASCHCMPIPRWLSPRPLPQAMEINDISPQRKTFSAGSWSLLIFFLRDSNYGPRSGVWHTLCLRTAPRRRRVAHLDALKGQAVASGLGSLAASRSHPSCLGKGRGISQALPGLAGIRAMSRSLGFRPAHLERFVLMVWGQTQAKPKPRYLKSKEKLIPQ